MFEDIISPIPPKEILKVFTCNYNVQTQCPNFSGDQMAICKYLELDGKICLFRNMIKKKL